jgi:hypothetical protein
VGNARYFFIYSRLLGRYKLARLCLHNLFNMTNKVNPISERKHYNRSRNLFVVALLFALVFAAWKFDVASIVTAEKRTPEVTFTNKPKSNAGSSESAIFSATSVGNARTGTSSGLNTSSNAQPEKENTFEICGLSASEAKAFIASRDKPLASFSNRGMAETVSKLVQSGNLREKTLGLFIATIQTSMAAADAERLNTPGCKADEPCFLKQFEAQMQARLANAEALVKLAQSSGDASVYAAALYACGSAVQGACSTISYSRLAEMAPDNAAAWLMVAGEANLKKDNVAVAKALQRAVDAKSYDVYTPPLASVLSSELVKAQTPLEQSLIATELRKIGSVVAFLKTEGVFSYCVSAGALDGGRRAICEALATKFVEKDETGSAVLVASKVGEKLGWSAERLQPLNDELDISTGQNFIAEINPNKFSCDNLVKSNLALQKSLTLGQRSATRQFVGKSGKSLSEVAAEYRKAMQL